MISLRKSTSSEFDKYENYFISDYSKEISKNYGYSIQKSISQAKDELHEGFPSGIPKPGNYLNSIELSGDTVIGYLWYSYDSKSDYAFICDFYIEKGYRNQGYGRACFHELETMLLKSGVNQVRLRVAYTNDRALKLYEEIGFKITGTNMVKQLNKT